MTQSFLERNKKKSLLALLLLFLRERKVLVLLLLVLLLASTVVLGPSSFVTSLPGGARFAAGVAWLAGKLGVDVSKWGLGPGDRNSYGDLVAAFRAAKAGSGKAAGWGAFFGHGGGDGGAVPNSLDMVRGSKSELDGVKSGDLANQTIQGVVDPADAAKDKEGAGVALSDGDLGGEREGFVKSAFAGGFMNGLLGGTGGSGYGAQSLNGLSGANLRGGAAGGGTAGGGGASGSGGLSGGAFAGKGFFASNGSAIGVNGKDLARIGMNGFTATKTPRSSIGGPAAGRLSGARSHVVEGRSMAGAARAGLNGESQAFFQLAQGNGRASLSVAPACAPPGCPGEFSATNSGAVYDGNNLGPTGVTAIIVDPHVDPYTTPNIPDTHIADNLINQAMQMDADAKKCQELDRQYGPQEHTLNAQMQEVSNQFKSADCGGGGCSKSKVRHCQALGDQMQRTCDAYMNVSCEHSKKCPLTASVDCSHECAGSHGQNAEAPTRGTSNTGGTGITPNLSCEEKAKLEGADPASCRLP